MCRLCLFALITLFMLCDRTPLEPMSEINGKTGSMYTSDTTTFAKKYCSYSTPIPHSFTKTFDGGYALFGNMYDDYIYLMKTDGSGCFMWDKIFNGNQGLCVRETPDHGLIMAVHSVYGLHDFPIFIKVDSLGSVQWQIPAESLYTAYSIAPSHDNGYVGTGYGKRITVFKLSSEGSLIWVKTYGDSLHSQGNSITRTTDNGFIIAGTRYSQVPGRYSDIFLMKIDPQGVLQWLKTFGGPYQDMGNSAIQTRDGGFVVAGHVTVDTAGKSETYLVKTDANGKTKWQKGYFPSIRGSGTDVCETSDGGFAICGKAYSKACIIRVSSSGTYKWTKSFDNTILATAEEIETTSNAGFAITGLTYSDDGEQRCFALVKTDSRGNFFDN